MSTTTIREACSCGASIDVEGGRYRSESHPANPRGAEQIVERWRIEHRHEFPPTPSPEAAGERETTLDPLVDRADPHGREVPVFGFQPRTEGDD